MSDDGFIEIADTSEIDPGQSKAYDIENVSVLICNVAAGFYAVENICSHDNSPLGEGKLIGCNIVCPRHGAEFDVKTGKVKKPPAFQPIETFPLKIQEGKIFIDID